MEMDSNDRTRFSWLKALGHSIGLGLAFLLPAFAFSAAGVVNAEKAGEFSAGFVVSGFILGWFWSYARQRGRSAFSHLLLFVLVAMSAYQVFVLGAAAVTRSKMPAVSALEDRPPTSHQTPSGMVLCQQDIGVRLALGELSLSAAPDLGETLRRNDPNDAVARWVFRDSSGGVVVLLASRGFDSEESLRNFLSGASRAAQGRMRKVHESVEWNHDHGSFLLSFRNDEEARFDMRCVSAANGNLACLQTIGTGPDRLAALRNGLSFASCP
jgi:hypothetical protein